MWQGREQHIKLNSYIRSSVDTVPCAVRFHNHKKSTAFSFILSQNIDEVSLSISLTIKVFKDNRLCYYIDGTSDNDNWLKFVNCARQSTEQNLTVVQESDNIYYQASRDIYCGEELLVWYGKTYEMYMGIPVGIVHTGNKITDNKKEIQKGKR